MRGWGGRLVLGWLQGLGPGVLLRNCCVRVERWEGVEDGQAALNTSTAVEVGQAIQ